MPRWVSDVLGPPAMAASAVTGSVLKTRPASRPSRSSTGDDRRMSAPAAAAASAKASLI